MTIETLTDEYRILLWDITGQHPANDRAYAVAKALRIIDAHAAERAALTEQVAQLTAALENIALGTVHPAEREVARLTDALASQQSLQEQNDSERRRGDIAEAALKQEKERFAAMILEFGELKDSAERRAEAAEREVARLTESLAAAKGYPDLGMKYRLGYRCIGSGAWQNTARYGYLALDFPSFTKEHGVPSNICSQDNTCEQTLLRRSLPTRENAT